MSQASQFLFQRHPQAGAPIRAECAPAPGGGTGATCHGDPHRGRFAER
jgi:hypothetical protein